MAKILVTNYSFDASEKKITFTDYNPLSLAGILFITNVTSNVVIYDFTDPNYGGTVATNVLTLTFSTVSQNDTDKLQIFYNDGLTETVKTSAVKAVEQVSDWSSVAQNTVVASSILDCSLNVAHHLAIQAFLDTETAHLGTRFLIQTSSSLTSTEDWQDYTEFIAMIGTGNTEPLTNNIGGFAPVGTTVLTCVSTVGYTNGAWRAIKDATLVNSELFFQIALTANTNITALDGTTNAHATNTNMYNIAMTQVIMLAPSVVRVRVVCDNTYSSSGSTCVFKVRINKATSL
jgi:hypothetical protein